MLLSRMLSLPEMDSHVILGRNSISRTLDTLRHLRMYWM